MAGKNDSVIADLLSGYKGGGGRAGKQSGNNRETVRTESGSAQLAADRGGSESKMHGESLSRSGGAGASTGHGISSTGVGQSAQESRSGRGSDSDSVSMSRGTTTSVDAGASLGQSAQESRSGRGSDSDSVSMSRGTTTSEGAGASHSTMSSESALDKSASSSREVSQVAAENIGIDAKTLAAAEGAAAKTASEQESAPESKSGDIERDSIRAVRSSSNGDAMAEYQDFLQSYDSFGASNASQAAKVTDALSYMSSDVADSQNLYGTQQAGNGSTSDATKAHDAAYAAQNDSVRGGTVNSTGANAQVDARGSSHEQADTKLPSFESQGVREHLAKDIVEKIGETREKSDSPAKETRQELSEVSPQTLDYVAKHGLPDGGLAELRAALGGEALGYSNLQLLDRAGAEAVTEMGEKGFPSEKVAAAQEVAANLGEAAGVKDLALSKLEGLELLNALQSPENANGILFVEAKEGQPLSLGVISKDEFAKAPDLVGTAVREVKDALGSVENNHAQESQEHAESKQAAESAQMQMSM